MFPRLCKLAGILVGSGLAHLGVLSLASAQEPPCVMQNEQATKLYNVGKHHEAIALLENVIDTVGKTPNLNQRRSANQIPKVKVCLIKANRSLASAQVNVGDHRSAMAHYSQAISLMLQHSQFDDIAAEIYWERGKAYEGQKLYTNAAADFSEAIKLNRANMKAWANRAVARFHLKQFAESIEDATEALKLNPEAADMFYVRGSSKLALKDRSGIADIQISARLGNAIAQDTLQKTGIEWQR